MPGGAETQSLCLQLNDQKSIPGKTMADSQPSAQKIALLARIELTNEESAKVQSEFDSILNYIHQIDNVEIPEGTEPFYGATESTNAVREDSIVPSFEREKILENAPDSDGEFYRVPPVF